MLLPEALNVQKKKENKNCMLKNFVPKTKKLLIKNA